MSNSFFTEVLNQQITGIEPALNPCKSRLFSYRVILFQTAV